jgi:UDP-N-acetylmuramate dehydrogenase
MIQLERNIQLQPFNTFGIKASARYWCRVASIDEVSELISQPVYQQERRLILGGGSNVLFTQDFEGLIIKSEMKGIAIMDEDEDRILVKVNAGEAWHDFVIHCVNNNWGGVENLSLIPGTIGAAPIQNIGAYGVEIKDVIEKVEAIDVLSGLVISFTREECCFGYRESVFKEKFKKKYFISSVTLSLTKKNHHFNIEYGAIKDILNQQRGGSITLQAISNAVMTIRKNKLPDPSLIGNAGSFFKNPTITYKHYELIKNINPTMPYYTTENQNVKIPAAWLIEQCGWKGKRLNNIGVHQHQALVLVNYGDGNGNDIFQLATDIASSVKEKFDITLTTEVNII